MIRSILEVSNHHFPIGSNQKWCSGYWSTGELRRVAFPADGWAAAVIAKQRWWASVTEATELWAFRRPSLVWDPTLTSLLLYPVSRLTSFPSPPVTSIPSPLLLRDMFGLGDVTMKASLAVIPFLPGELMIKNARYPIFRVLYLNY